MNNIKDIIDSLEFRKAIEEAIEYGKSIDYYYDGEDESPFETFNVYSALEQVIEVIKEKLL